jgi:hypothetical protein
VINARGEVSSRGIREIEDLQRALLRSEGVDFNRAGRVDLTRFAWQPRGTRAVAGKWQKSAHKRGAARARKNAQTAGGKR